MVQRLVKNESRMGGTLDDIDTLIYQIRIRSKLVLKDGNIDFL